MLKINNLKWIIIFLFPIGYFYTFSSYNGFFNYYLFLNFVAFMFCLFLLKKLKSFSLKNIIIWIILLIFIFGYYFQFYLILANRNDFDFLTLVYGYNYTMLLNSISDKTFLTTFEIISFSFFAFCVTVLIFLKDVSKCEYKFLKTNKYSYFVRFSFGFLLLGSFIGNFLVFYFRLNIPEEAVHLPFKISGIIYYAVTLIIPLFALVMLDFSERFNRKNDEKLYILFLFLHCMFLYLLTGVKTILFLPLMLLFLLWFSHDKLTHSRIRFVLAIFLSFVVIYPFLNTYRSILRNELIYGFLNILTIKDNFVDDFNLFKIIFWGIIYISTRITGANSLILIVDFCSNFAINKHSFVELVLSSKSLDYFYTTDIIGFDEEIIKGTNFASSLLGQFFYLTESKIASSIMMSFWILCFYSIFKKILQLKVLTSNVVAIFSLYIFTIFSVDGFKLKQFIAMFFLIIFSILILEKLLKKIAIIV